MKKLILFLILSVTFSMASTLEFTVDAQGATQKVSPYIYGKNHGISQNSDVPTHADTITKYLDAGLTMVRMNNGNNASKYNWKRKKTSHPDWYNNVYDNDWDFSAQEINDRLTGVQGLFAISMLGWCAKTDEYNFNDGLYNGYAWWIDENTGSIGTNNNWAGTPPISAEGEKPSAPHDPELYLERCSVEENLGIMDHWFGSGADQLGLDKNNFLYWNTDNEADIWHSTHDDVMPDTMSAEDFVQIYVDAALKARAKFPEIKIVGPVLTNEWQWYKWHEESIEVGGKYYPFIEYVIKRIGEEQKRTGKRLVDVFDIHFYPGYNEVSDRADILQVHRVWFDTTYAFSGSNGLKTSTGAWDDKLNKQYILLRIRRWLDQYVGENHGITTGLTEFGTIDGIKNDASAAAVWYASQLGEFGAAGDVELFTPWDMYNGMFETMHLFTTYGKELALNPQHSEDHLLSIYPSISAAGDSLTVIVVNRQESTQTLNLKVSDFVHGGTWVPAFDLAYLRGETFKNKSSNALYAHGIDLDKDKILYQAEPMSVNALVFSLNDPGTKPEFAEREIPPSSSSSDKGSSASGENTVVWDYEAGAQVRQPSGKLGDWWYNYCDTLSTMTDISADGINTNQSISVEFIAKQNEEQAWNYAGIGFSWASTPTGSKPQSIDLSEYAGICLDYESTVGLQGSLGQVDGSDDTKTQSFMPNSPLWPKATKRSTHCVKWEEFGAGSKLNLKQQVNFQLQTGESATWTIWQISLEKTASSVQSKLQIANNFSVQWHGNLLHLQTPKTTRYVQIYSPQGKLWQRIDITSPQQSVSLDLPAGLYILRTNQGFSTKLLKK
ncbi:MAG: T9SS type A sorting domain-containing protein [Fibrobacter sp.]|nr:T9SS type A sorting domain-containing protein [Fibrobacter sp.]